MANALHNIICLEAEWEYRYDKRNNKFSLNTEPLLNWLRTFHGCDIVYRHILNKQDLKYYLDYFASHKREFKKYDIIYIACHGWHHAISLEGEEGDSGYFRLAGACHEYSVASLNMKNFTSPTPRNCVRKALIFALNDSAEALVSLSSK